MKVQKIVLLLVRTAAAHTKRGGMPGMTRLRLAAIAAFLLFVLGVGAQAPVASGDAVGPGCDPARPAVAYHAGGMALPSHQGDLPIPCAVVTGSTIETATVGVTSRGTLVYAPQTTGAAVKPAVTTSIDDGATWHVQTPTTLQTGTGSAIPWMHVDPETNRIWFAMIGPLHGCPPANQTLAQITWSDDEGATWHAPPGDSVDCRQLQGGMSVVEGPAPHGQPQPVGYPHVVYHCGNITDGAIPLSVHCWKSLDGGQTWSFVQGPNNPPCTGKYGGRGRAVGRDGTLYMSIQCPPVAGGVAIAGPGPLYLASSRDEGNTWDYQFVVNTSYEATEELLVSSLGVDHAGNLYIGWTDSNNHPMLIVGKGSRWGSPLNIAEPGVNYVNRVAVAVNNPGHVAIAYVGSTGGISGTFNGYITESKDALGEDPTFLGAPVNDPAKPLMSSAYAEAVTATRGRIWLLTAAFGPDGTPWAAFHCANLTAGVTTGMPSPSITCPNGAAAPAAPPLALGVVGRLASHHDHDHGKDHDSDDDHDHDHD